MQRARQDVQTNRLTANHQPPRLVCLGPTPPGHPDLPPHRGARHLRGRHLPPRGRPAQAGAQRPRGTYGRACHCVTAYRMYLAARAFLAASASRASLALLLRTPVPMCILLPQRPYVAIRQGSYAHLRPHTGTRGATLRAPPTSTSSYRPPAATPPNPFLPRLLLSLPPPCRSAGPWAPTPVATGGPSLTGGTLGLSERSRSICSRHRRPLKTGG